MLIYIVPNRQFSPNLTCWEIYLGLKYVSFKAPASLSFHSDHSKYPKYFIYQTLLDIETLQRIQSKVDSSLYLISKYFEWTLLKCGMRWVFKRECPYFLKFGFETHIKSDIFLSKQDLWKNYADLVYPINVVQ